MMIGLGRCTQDAKKPKGPSCRKKDGPGKGRSHTGGIVGHNLEGKARHSKHGKKRVIPTRLEGAVILFCRGKGSTAQVKVPGEVSSVICEEGVDRH